MVPFGEGRRSTPKRSGGLVSWLVIGVVMVLLGPSAQPASGQALLAILFGDKLSTETFQMGMNLDLAWAGVSSIDGTSTRRAFSFGAYGEIKLSDRWRLQPELTIKTPGGAEDLAYRDPAVPFELVGDSLIDEAVLNGSVTRSSGYVSLPVLLRYIAGPVGIGVGGQLAYMTRTNDRLESEVLQGQVQLEQSITDSMNRWDGGLVFSLDYALNPPLQMRSMRINAKYHLGLTDTVKDNPGDAVRNSILFIGLDVPVGGSSAAEEVAGGR
jgi:hypothetical protein